MKIDEKLSASGGLTLTRGSTLDPAGGSAPDPRYRLALHAPAMVRPLPLDKSWIRPLSRIGSHSSRSGRNQNKGLSPPSHPSGLPLRRAKATVWLDEPQCIETRASLSLNPIWHPNNFSRASPMACRLWFWAVCGWAESLFPQQNVPYSVFAIGTMIGRRYYLDVNFHTRIPTFTQCCRQNCYHCRHVIDQNRYGTITHNVR